MPKAKLSAIVLTKDSQDVIKDCLESLTFADEIVVIDDRSTDRTAGICKNYTDNVFIDNVEGLVHERLVLDGPIGTIEEATEHRPFQNIAQFLERQNRYTVYEARDLLNKRGKLPEKEVIYNLTWKPLKLFLKFYLKKQGFREGMIGFIFSVLFSYVHFMKWTKYWELTYGQKAR